MIELSEPAPGVGHLVIHGAQGNVVDTMDIATLAYRLREAAREKFLVVVITGHGADFCGGRLATPGLQNLADLRADLQPVVDVGQILDQLDALVITGIEGAALGFGFGLVVQSDISVAATAAQFAFPEFARGIPPLLVLSYLTRHVPYRTALNLTIGAAPLSAAQAHALGLVSDVVSTGSAVELALARARVAATGDREALRLLRRFARQVSAPFDAHRSAEAADLIAQLLYTRAQQHIEISKQEEGP